MQAYTPSNESTDFRGSSAKRGLSAMSPEYVGANYLESGTVASFEDPQITTNNIYTNQSKGENLRTDVSGKTVEAARNADRAITESSGAEEHAQLYNRFYTGATMQSKDLESRATEKLGRIMDSPEEQQQLMGNIAISRAQNSMLG